MPCLTVCPTIFLFPSLIQNLKRMTKNSTRKGSKSSSCFSFPFTAVTCELILVIILCYASVLLSVALVDAFRRVCVCAIVACVILHLFGNPLYAVVLFRLVCHSDRSNSDWLKPAGKKANPFEGGDDDDDEDDIMLVCCL